MVKQIIAYQNKEENKIMEQKKMYGYMRYVLSF